MFRIIAANIGTLGVLLALIFFWKIWHLTAPKRLKICKYFWSVLLVIVFGLLLGFVFLTVRFVLRYVEGNVLQTVESQAGDFLIILGGAFVFLVAFIFFHVVQRLYNETNTAQHSENKLNTYSTKLEKMVKDKTEDLEAKEEELRKSHLAVMNILEDVTAEKNKLNAILHSIGDGVVALDASGNISLINDIASKLLGISHEKGLGQHYRILQFFKNEEHKQEDTTLQEALKSGELTHFAGDAFVTHNDGSTIPIAGSVAPIKNKEGDILGVIVVFRDISREREIEKSKSEFVSFVSHQLRTPLTGMKWYVEMLLQDEQKNLSDEQKGLLSQLLDSDDRLIKLVNDLLDVAKIENQEQFVLEKESVDIFKLVQGVINDNVARIQAKKLDVTNSIDAELKMNVDSEKIQQVFHNIISNAVKYCKGKVEISAKEGEEGMTFAITDDGIGIPEEQQERMFQKFFRADNAKERKISGTGLGLYIVKIIVEAHGGKIWFESEKDKGTTFYFSLS